MTKSRNQITFNVLEAIYASICQRRIVNHVCLGNQSNKSRLTDRRGCGRTKTPSQIITSFSGFSDKIYKKPIHNEYHNECSYQECSYKECFNWLLGVSNILVMVYKVLRWGLIEIDGVIYIGEKICTKIFGFSDKRLLCH